MTVLSSLPEAREFIEARLPDAAIRLRYVSGMAAAMREVNRRAPNQWAVTVTAQNRLRLVVGHYFTFTLLDDGRIWLALDNEGYQAALKPSALEAEAFVRGWKESPPDDYPHYAVPKGPRKGQWLSTGGYYNLREADPADWPKVEGLLFAFIANALENGQPMRQATREAHSSGVIKYMRQELVPDSGR